MSNKIYDELKTYLKANKFTWLVTGAAGFIGSHLVEELILLRQKVIGVDNFLTGKKSNYEFLSHLSENLSPGDFEFYEIDLTKYDSLDNFIGVDYVLHQAALGSVPRSIINPHATHFNNVDTFLNVLLFSKKASVKRLVYASSSSLYGNSKKLPKIEGNEGDLLSPYAATKKINEIYAQTFSKTFGLEAIGLRYFNVFGPRQDPNGQYAAVIPKWIKAIYENKPITIYGDGKTTRDFCYVKNAVQANLLSALSRNDDAINKSYNIACGSQITLNQLAEVIERELKIIKSEIFMQKSFKDFRAGDIRHSLANIDNAKEYLGYRPTHSFFQGISETITNEFSNV
jgi:UDP-N-acetylglucosamine 4-epimerase